MSTNPFAAPAAPADGIKWADHKGRLLIIEPTAHEQGIQTVHGPSDAIRADVHSLTGPTEADVFADCLIFPKVLQGQLRSRLGEKVIGRLVQGNAKAGQSPPWMLEEATADDIQKGISYLAHVAKPSVSSASPAPAASGDSSSSDVPF